MHIHSHIYAGGNPKNKTHTPRIVYPKRMGFCNLFVVGIAGEHVIGVEDGDHDQCGKSGGEATVEEDEAAVHTCRGRAYDCVDQTCKQALLPTVFSGNGTKSRCEGNAVDIRLRGKHPRNGSVEESVYDANECKEHDIAENDGSDVSRVLSVCDERQRGKDCADGGTRKSRGDGQLNGRENYAEQIGHDEDDVQICEKAEPVNAEVDKADGHSEFRREIGSASRAAPKVVVIVKISAVHEKAEDDRCQEENEEKDIHEYDVRIVEGFVDGVISDNDVRRGKSERTVEQCVRANTEDTDGKPRLIHIVALLYCGYTGEQRGNDKARKRAENDCEDHAGKAELDCSEVELTDGVTEEQVADEGRKRGGEHGDVQIFADGGLGDQTIDQNAYEGRPHIQKIKSVKAVRDDENICREGFCVGSRSAEEDHQIAGKSAQSCVEKRACQASQIKIVCDQLGG